MLNKCGILWKTFENEKVFAYLYGEKIRGMGILIPENCRNQNYNSYENT